MVIVNNKIITSINVLWRNSSYRTFNVVLYLSKSNKNQYIVILFSFLHNILCLSFILKTALQNDVLT